MEADGASIGTAQEGPVCAAAVAFEAVRVQAVTPLDEYSAWKVSN